MRTIKVMEEKYRLPSMELVEAVLTDYENPEDAKITRALAEEIRGKDLYVPELELVMVDAQDEVIGYCMFSRFRLEGKHENELLILCPAFFHGTENRKYQRGIIFAVS